MQDDKIQTNIAESWKTYKISTSPDFMLYDFYVLSYISTLKLDHRDKGYRGSFLGRPVEELNLDIEAAEATLLPVLKTQLLSAVFYAICAEIRHMYDIDQGDKYTNIPKEYNKLLYAYSKQYMGRHHAPKSLYRLHPREIGSVKTGTRVYTMSYKAALHAIDATNSSKLQFIDMCLYLFGNFHWRSSYGGPKWVEVVNGWKRLYTAKTKSELYIAIDHVYDLQHNTGTVLNKVKNYYVKNSLSWLATALDFKASAKSIYQLLPRCSSDMRKLANEVFKSANIPPLAPKESPSNKNSELTQAEMEKLKQMVNAKQSYKKSSTPLAIWKQTYPNYLPSKVFISNQFAYAMVNDISDGIVTATITYKTAISPPDIELGKTYTYRIDDIVVPHEQSNAKPPNDNADKGIEVVASLWDAPRENTLQEFETWVKDNAGEHPDVVWIPSVKSYAELIKYNVANSLVVVEFIHKTAKSPDFVKVGKQTTYSIYDVQAIATDWGKKFDTEPKKTEQGAGTVLPIPTAGLLTPLSEWISENNTIPDICWDSHPQCLAYVEVIKLGAENKTAFVKVVHTTTATPKMIKVGRLMSVNVQDLMVSPGAQPINDNKKTEFVRIPDIDTVNTVAISEKYIKELYWDAAHFCYVQYKGGFESEANLIFVVRYLTKKSPPHLRKYQSVIIPKETKYNIRELINDGVSPTILGKIESSDINLFSFFWHPENRFFFQLTQDQPGPYTHVKCKVLMGDYCTPHSLLYSDNYTFALEKTDLITTKFKVIFKKQSRPSKYTKDKDDIKDDMMWHAPPKSTNDLESKKNSVAIEEQVVMEPDSATMRPIRSDNFVPGDIYWYSYFRCFVRIPNDIKSVNDILHKNVKVLFITPNTPYTINIDANVKIYSLADLYAITHNGVAKERLARVKPDDVKKDSARFWDGSTYTIVRVVSHIPDKSVTVQVVSKTYKTQPASIHSIKAFAYPMSWESFFKTGRVAKVLSGV
jgi:hypothetical protein